MIGTYLFGFKNEGAGVPAFNLYLCARNRRRIVVVYAYDLVLCAGRRSRSIFRGCCAAVVHVVYHEIHVVARVVLLRTVSRNLRRGVRVFIYDQRNSLIGQASVHPLDVGELRRIERERNLISTRVLRAEKNVFDFVDLS